MRTIVLLVDIEGRLANLIKKGSYVDINVNLKGNTAPKTVLSKVRDDEYNKKFI